jgi:nicotinate-nucleotide adenylyltransferase
VARIGILGGTFNPPHLGHLALVRHARDELGLERVLLMPAHSAPHKQDEGDPGSEHRLRMCRLAVEGVAWLAACALEIERGGPSYTVDTLRAVHASHLDAELTFIVGADMARTLPAWREPGELLGLASLAVAERKGAGSAAEGGGREDVLRALAGLLAGGQPATTDRRSASVVFLGMPAIEISSSVVRERVARGGPVEQLVGGAVAQYIDEHGLYRSEEGPAH